MDIMNSILLQKHILDSDSRSLKNKIAEHYKIPWDSFYLTLNGKIFTSDTTVKDEIVHHIQIVPRVLGGKGGFGSMLRAIGAQIEKTTNREACRDLSGRRLRDINEEQRLKNWINQQAEREKEAKVRKKKKLEKLCEQPKHEFKDTEYDKERSELPEIVEDAVLQGIQASSSGTSTSKRKSTKEEVLKKKKRKLWMDAELDEDLSSDENDSEDEGVSNGKSQEKKTENINKTPSLTKSTENLSESDPSGQNKVSDSVPAKAQEKIVL